MKLGICVASELIKNMFKEVHGIDIDITVTDLPFSNIVEKILDDNLYETRFISLEEADYILTKYSYGNVSTKKHWEAPYKGQTIEFYDDYPDDYDEDDEEEMFPSEEEFNEWKQSIIERFSQKN